MRYIFHQPFLPSVIDGRILVGPYICVGCGIVRQPCDGGTDSVVCDHCWWINQHSILIRWLLRLLFVNDSHKRHGCGLCSKPVRKYRG